MTGSHAVMVFSDFCSNIVMTLFYRLITLSGTGINHTAKARKSRIIFSSEAVLYLQPVLNPKSYDG